jgi:hypothetical protein
VANAEQDLETIRFYVFAVPGSLQARALVSIPVEESGMNHARPRRFKPSDHCRLCCTNLDGATSGRSASTKSNAIDGRSPDIGRASRMYSNLFRIRRRNIPDTRNRHNTSDSAPSAAKGTKGSECG